MKVACLMMQKNEAQLLAPWIQYYSRLFGAENLYIYDNGSTMSDVLHLLDQAEEAGLNVNRAHSEKSDFENKGEIIARRIKELDEKDDYDFFFPLDCDEFIGVEREGEGPSFRKSDILEELAQHKDAKRVLFIGKGYDNHPAMTGMFRPTTEVRKTFFSKQTCESLDIGFHDGKSKHGGGKRATNFVYAHYHWKPFEYAQRHTREKLGGRVPNFDRDTLIAHRDKRGAGHHLVKVLLHPDAASYYAAFKPEKYLHLTSFIDAMDEYGIPTPYSDIS